MKAHEAPMPIISTSTAGGMPMRSAMAANTGTSSAAEAVLLVNSVRMMMKVVTPRMMTNGPAPVRKAAT